MSALLRRWRLWPQSLSGRLALILVAGMLAAQMLTGTIWYDMRYGNAMEMPARLAAARLADAVLILDDADAAQRPELARRLSRGEFVLALRPAPAAHEMVPPQPALSRGNEAVADLFGAVLQKHAGAREWRMLQVDLDDQQGSHEDAWLTLLVDEFPHGRFRALVALKDGGWLQAEIREGQAGMSTAPQSAAFDYFLRIYALRIFAVVLIAWMAVRLAMKPLQVMANAAEKLGRNIHSPPLATDGPTEVRTAAQAFNAMQRRIIDNIAERTRFLASVSHDLRSPITRMKLRTELLADEERKEKFRKDLDEMDAMISATLNVVQDIDVQEHRQLIDLDSLLESLRSDQAEVGREVTVSGHAAPLHGYPRSLRRCLQNVVENAVRYGQRARVRLDDGAERVTITVDDDGPGIAEDMLERVLEPFYRLERSRNAATGGFGLGLSIAATVAQAHRGEIALANRAGGGLRASIVIPR
ncbi:ATP-binding protein [Herbaspirillum robiniae]|uniref:histidine kinase n=1 Tax=Herbaspirillum robiniae TaxID=2014887 RepID=A0ABX2LSJ1_9BURK|nr:ATP-binding protein [Herbaspirillum robiniae]NUU00629.1 HAMP domain-containing protein [Herbaspirillum robiniae]